MTRAASLRETRRGYVAHAAAIIATPRSAIIDNPVRSYDSESDLHALSVQVAAVPDDREPHRAADHRIPDEEDRRPRCRAGGTVPGGLRDIHVGAAAW